MSEGKRGRPKKNVGEPSYSMRDVEKHDVKVTPIFYDNFYSTADIVANRGSAGSSKSHSVLQVLVYRFCTMQNISILMLRKTLPSMRLSTLPHLRKVFKEFGITNRVKEEKVFLNFLYSPTKDSTNLIHLGSVDDKEKIKCFHPDTDILTINGFRNIKDIKVGDLVATMNPETRETEYKPVTNFWEYDYEGKMYEPDTTGSERKSNIRFNVTSNHRMLRKNKKGLEFIEAKELVDNRDYYNYLPISSVFNTGDIVNVFEVPKINNDNYKLNGRKETKFDITSWLRFLGWYLSEGSLNKQKVFIAQTKKETVEILKKDLYNLKIGFGKEENGFYIYSKDLSTYLKQFGLSGNKYIPREILNLHPSLLKHIFDTLILGDGFVRTKDKFTYTTISKQLAEDVCELSLKLGYAVFMRKPQLTYKRDKLTYTVSIRKAEYGNVCKIKSTDYEGKVYCVEVEPYHTIMSRYDGCCLWTGNSSEWNMIWIEEATEFAYDDFKTISLYNRAPNHNKGAKNQVFLSFNPIDEYHWLREKLLLDERTMRINKVEEIHSTYRDNPFLPDDTRRKYDALVDQDINYYRIYGLGEWGKLDSVIYNNWDIVPNDLSIEGEVFFGLDFGYNDPTALVKCTVVGDEVWEEELLYEKGLNNQQLIQRVKEAIPSKLSMRPIFCDTAEPDKIAELRLAGLNAKNANKSVNDGIDFIKRLKIHIIDGSDNIIKEKRSYSWRKDREGHPMDKPIDFMDHLMSAERYALYTPLRRRNLYQCIWL